MNRGWVLCLGFALCWSDLGAQSIPDFAAPVGVPRLRRAVGPHPLLVILWDSALAKPGASEAERVDRLFFGPGPNVADWFRENSGGRFTVTRAGVLGWYRPGPARAAAPSTRSADASVGPAGADGWGEALHQASREFDFAAYDRDRDGRLTPDELGVILVTAHREPAGVQHSWPGRDYPGRAPLVADGVRIPNLAEVRLGVPPNLGCAAHELAHLWLGLPDLYTNPSGPSSPGAFCLMDACFTTTHLNPYYKLKLGWVDYGVANPGNDYSLPDVETGGRVLVLSDPARGSREYFLLEYRYPGRSYDAGRGDFGAGLPASGLAVWHVVEPSPRGDRRGLGDWGRRAIRLVRANGGSPLRDALALLDKVSMSIGGDTRPAALTWADGTPAPFRVQVRGLSSQGVELRVESPRVATPAPRGGGGSLATAPTGPMKKTGEPASNR